jgi:hypothetical protein
VFCWGTEDTIYEKMHRLGSFKKIHGMGSLKNARNGKFRKMHGMGRLKKFMEWEV